MKYLLTILIALLFACCSHKENTQIKIINSNGGGGGGTSGAVSCDSCGVPPIFVEYDSIKIKK